MTNKKSTTSNKSAGTKSSVKTVRAKVPTEPTPSRTIKTAPKKGSLARSDIKRAVKAVSAKHKKK